MCKSQTVWVLGTLLFIGLLEVLRVEVNSGTKTLLKVFMHYI